jgi:hypothetical protein
MPYNVSGLYLVPTLKNKLTIKKNNKMKNETSNFAETEALNKCHVTSSATDNNWRKCKHCGKFISYRQMEEYKDVMFHFIPDSEITTEEAYWVHRHCI